MNVERQLASLGQRDVLIAPELGDISAGSFERSADAIRIGEDAARALAASLGRYSLPPEQYDALRRRQVSEVKPMGSVDEIRFEGLQRTNPEVLAALVESKPGEPLTEEKISADLRRIYGRGDFESVDYHIQQDPGRRVLVIQPREKEWGPDYLRFGLGLATDFQGENFFNILAQYRRTWLNRLGGEWLSEAQVGQSTFFFTEFNQPVEERGRYFVVALLQGRTGTARRIRRRQPGGGIPDERDAPRPRWRRAVRHLGRGPAGRGMEARARAHRDGTADISGRAGDHGRAAGCDVRRPARQRLVSAQGLPDGRRRIRGR